MSPLRGRERLRSLLPLLVLSAGVWSGGCAPEPAAQGPVDSSAGEPTESAPRLSRAQSSAAGDPNPPVRDLLLITVDTLRADALGFTGNARSETPVLDRLARSGRVYTSAHAHNVVTLPSHANILTGRLPYEHGVRDNSSFVLDDRFPTAAGLLGDAGFATAAVVAAFPLDARYGLDRGFDLYDDRYPEGGEESQFRLTERSGEEVVDRALSWWRAHEGERRFLWIHLFEPHAPYEPPEPFASRFDDEPYLGEVATTDAYLAPLLGPLLERTANRPFVVMTSDHGESLGEHGEITHGLFAYEATLRVPLVLWGPGIDSGTTDEPVRHVDLLPTLLDAADVEPPLGLPGRSLLQPVEEEAETSTYFEALSANLNRGWAPLRGVLRDGEKLIELPIPELYDLDVDPGEQRNLYPERARRARALERLLPTESDWRSSRRQPSAAERSALQSLGYLSGSARSRRDYGPEDDPKNLVAVDRTMHRFIDLYQRGRLEEATALVRSVLRERPRMGVAYEHLARVLLERGKKREALEALREASRRGVATPPAVRQLALLHLEAGHPEEAVELLESLAATEPAGGDPGTLNALTVALAEAGRLSEAGSVVSRVFARDPRNPEAHQNLALIALRKRDWSRARKEAQTALDGNEGLHHAWNYLGVALYNLGEPAEAVRAWERAVALAPDDFDLLYNLGLVAAQIGETERARTALERFVADAPRDRYSTDIAKARNLLQRLPS